MSRIGKAAKRSLAPWSPKHAGEPHRGRITEAEKSYVREHLDQVNKRLRGKGMRTIDANDPTMRERYGLLEQIRY
jgi:hypothetical protein